MLGGGDRAKEDRSDRFEQNLGGKESWVRNPAEINLQRRSRNAFTISQRALKG
jgi:hypothetical protein